MKPIDSALIGCGRIGYLLDSDPLRKKPCTHFHGARSAGILFNYAVDIDASRLKEISKNESIPDANCFTDYKTLFKEAAPQIVTIATWTESHDRITVAAAENNTKIIILEKPVASSLDKARRIIDACSSNNCRLFINHERRYDPRYQKAKSIIQNGSLGSIKTVHASVLTGPYRGTSDPAQGGGPLLHDGTHIIDILRYFFGEITTVRGAIQRDNREKGFEDSAIAWLKTAEDVNIFLEAGGSRKYFAFEIIVSGTEGKLIIGNGYEKLYTTGTSQFYKGFRDLKNKKFPAFNSTNYFTNLYKEAIAHLNSSKEDITSAGIDGYKTLEIIHSIYLSAHNNGKDISLPLNKKINLKKIFEI